ncbi:MAG: transposon-encoded TnpW family protein [Ruminiclostridium sp.]|nr:transposon-encoded TnpW family protein [Ruminiclostridium sp.]
MGENSKTEPLKSSVSEYKFGYTTFIVETHFNLECSETLEDILKRLMINDADEIFSAS